MIVFVVVIVVTGKKTQVEGKPGMCGVCFGELLSLTELRAQDEDGKRLKKGVLALAASSK